MTPPGEARRQLGVVDEDRCDTNRNAIMERPELMGKDPAMLIADQLLSPDLCCDTSIEALGIRERNRGAVAMSRRAMTLEHGLDTLQDSCSIAFGHQVVG